MNLNETQNGRANTIADQDRRKLLAQIGVGGAIVWAAPALSGTALAQGTPSGCTPLTVD